MEDSGSSNTISSIKRLMGRNFNDKEIQYLVDNKRFDYVIKPHSMGTENSIVVMLNNKEHTPEQISAKILEKIKNDCQKYLKTNIEYAVVTVPAYFNDKQKMATRTAVVQAGFKVKRLLPEPTAAAISFGVDSMSEGESNTVLVYDLGGGTFDISILTITNGRFIEQGKAGDMWMGGDDIDNIIIEYVLEKTELDNDISNTQELIDNLPLKKKNRFLNDLKYKVENAKISLSANEKAYIEIVGLLKDKDGDLLDIDVELTRHKFEQLILPLVEKSVYLVKKVISEIDFYMDLIDKVIMVGGSSSIPLIVKKMKEIFGDQKVIVHKRPMKAIAEGAAILAHRLADFSECPSCGHENNHEAEVCSKCNFNLIKDLSKKGVVDIIHTTSHDYYLELEDGSGYKLVEQNTPLPYKTNTSFKLLNKEQQLVHFKFFNIVNDNKETIGDLWLSVEFEETDTDKLQEVIIDIEIDENNIFAASAMLKDNPDVKVCGTISRGKSDEKLFMELEQSISRINSEKHEYYVVYDFLVWSIDIAKIINQIINAETGERNQKIYQNALKKLDNANQMVEQEETVFSNLNYMENFLEQFGPLLDENDYKKIVNKLKIFKEKIINLLKKNLNC